MILKALFLAGLFALGLVEAFVLKLRNTACVTWVIALLALTIWIAYPFTPIRLFICMIIAVTGFVLVTRYYKSTEPEKH